MIYIIYMLFTLRAYTLYLFIYAYLHRSTNTSDVQKRWFVSGNSWLDPGFDRIGPTENVNLEEEDVVPWTKKPTRWWFQIGFHFHPNPWGKWSNLTSIFFRWVETTRKRKSDVKSFQLCGSPFAGEVSTVFFLWCALWNMEEKETHGFVGGVTVYSNLEVLIGCAEDGELIPTPGSPQGRWFER